ncbi:MAG: phage/plasmid primase, P4 family [Candidatus Bathyarchaeia archaeon]|jgi:putative DNA primase/helicase
MTETPLTVLEAALAFYDSGLVVIPLKSRDKTPALDTWCQYEKEKPSREQTQAWFTNNNVNIGIICGDISNGFIVQDFDSEEAFTKFFGPDANKIKAEAPTVRTGRGLHVWYRSEEHGIRGFRIAELEMDLKANGGYVVAPPSIHSNGSTYTFLNELREPLRIKDLVKSIRTRCQQLGVKTQREIVPIKEILAGVDEGRRDTSAIQLATYFRQQNLTPEETLLKMQEWNQLNKPPLPDDQIRLKVGNAYKTEKPYRWWFLNGNADFFSFDAHGNKHFEPVKFANYLTGLYQFKVMEDNFDIFVYSPAKGIWEEKGNQVIRREMGKLLDDDNRKRYVEDVKHAVICAKDMMVPRPIPPVNKLAVLNGILNLETGTVEQPSPDQFIVVQIPVKFDPAAKCPNIDQFLSQVVPESMIPLLIESVAYCLWQAMPIHKALMLIGGGSNGKSTFQKVMTKFLGEENTTSATLQSLCETRFMAAELYLKLANLSADLPDKALTRTGMFKTTTGGDRVQGEKKFKNPFWFYNYAKQIYSCNQIPSTPDDTDAYYRRWNIVEFPTKFQGENCDPNILDKLTTPEELSGLLNKTLEVLPALLKRGAFSSDETIEQIRDKYILKSNSAKAFIEARLQASVNHTDQIFKEELYREYVYFCGERKLVGFSGSLGCGTPFNADVLEIVVLVIVR